MPRGKQDALRSATVLRFDPDDLSLADWAHVEAIDNEPGTPWGTLWPEGTPLLRKLAVWAGYARWRQQLEEELGSDS